MGRSLLCIKEIVDNDSKLHPMATVFDRIYVMGASDQELRQSFHCVARQVSDKHGLRIAMKSAVGELLEVQNDGIKRRMVSECFVGEASGKMQRIGEAFANTLKNVIV